MLFLPSWTKCIETNASTTVYSSINTIEYGITVSHNFQGVESSEGVCVSIGIIFKASPTREPLENGHSPFTHNIFKLSLEKLWQNGIEFGLWTHSVVPDVTIILSNLDKSPITAHSGKVIHFVMTELSLRSLCVNGK